MSSRHLHLTPRRRWWRRTCCTLLRLLIVSPSQSVSHPADVIDSGKDVTVDRHDWLLLLLDKSALGLDGPTKLDPVRIQKGMFLLSKVGPAPGLYEFRPYHWGPFSRDVYSDLNMLQARGLVKSLRVPGQSWSTYTVTPLGESRAMQIGEQLDPGQVEWVRKLRLFLTTRSFKKLLTDVYNQFPEFASKSRLQ